MKVHMVSPKYLLILSSTKLMIKYSAIKVIFAALWTTGFHLLQLGLISKSRSEGSFWAFLDEKSQIESADTKQAFEEDRGLI